MYLVVVNCSVGSNRTSSRLFRVDIAYGIYAQTRAAPYGALECERALADAQLCYLSSTSNRMGLYKLFVDCNIYRW